MGREHCHHAELAAEADASKRPAPTTAPAHVVPLPVLASSHADVEPTAAARDPLARLRRTTEPVGAPIRRVFIDGKDIKQTDPAAKQHVKNLTDALGALADAQNQDETDPSTWMWWVTDINTRLQASGVNAAILTEIEKFYTEVEELSFLSNPFLRQVWQNCLDATRSAAAKSKYSQVGSKFLRQSLLMLEEIKTDFSSHADLVQLCNDVAGFMKGYNKEHLVNKGGSHLGPQVDHVNLMGAGTPLGTGGSSISPLHQGLHAMKAGTGKLDYTALHPKIRAVIEKCQKKYSTTTMGTF